MKKKRISNITNINISCYISGVGSYVVRLNVTSKFWLGRKDCIVCRFNLPISKSIGTRNATLIYYLAGR